MISITMSRSTPIGTTVPLRPPRKRRWSRLRPLHRLDRLLLLLTALSWRLFLTRLYHLALRCPILSTSPVSMGAPAQIGSRGNELSVCPTARPCVMICTCAVIRRYEGARNMCLHSRYSQQQVYIGLYKTSVLPPGRCGS